jgi:alkaline phosphatase D
MDKLMKIAKLIYRRPQLRHTFFLPLFVIAGIAWSFADSPEEQPLRRIAFGSCAKQDQPQPIWDSIVELKPQIFVFLGDNIYGDTNDMAVLKKKWDLLGAQPGYQKLKQSCSVLATWDDHDYGADDAGTEYPWKRDSQQLFLDFFDVPQDSPRRDQEGVYNSQISGPPGQRVQIILLDLRYFRSPLKLGFQPGEPGEGFRGKYADNLDPTATFLGDAQWKWLEEQLKLPAELRIIGSSLQFLPDEHGSEAWGNFPLERKRLLQLIRETKASGVIMISGDRHLSEMMRLAPGASGLDYPLFEATSSSLNAPSGNFTKAGIRFMNEVNSYRVGLTYFDTNFGFIEVDWVANPPVIRLQVRDETGGPVLQQKFKLSDLQSP